MIRWSSARAQAGQLLLLGAVLAAVWWLGSEAAAHMARRHMSFGFGFLADHANFDIPFRIIAWSVGDTYARALLVCTANTLLVSVLAIVAATVFGLVIGIARLSGNFLVRNLALWYVELFRNTPQLVQIVFWYVAVLQALPSPRRSIELPFGALLNIRGLYLPTIGGTPALHGFNITGGVQVVPELLAVWAGLTMYAAAFIAEIGRGAILAVHRGQREAAASLGLRSWQVMRLVVLPQAVRMMVPPLTSQYLNIIKSSSLGAAVAYPELFQIFAGTVLNQSGRELECMILLMAVFLSINLVTSLFMNWYNHRIALVER